LAVTTAVEAWPLTTATVELVWLSEELICDSDVVLLPTLTLVVLSEELMAETDAFVRTAVELVWLSEELMDETDVDTLDTVELVWLSEELIAETEVDTLDTVELVWLSEELIAETEVETLDTVELVWLSEELIAETEAPVRTAVELVALSEELIAETEAPVRTAVELVWLSEELMDETELETLVTVELVELSEELIAEVEVLLAASELLMTLKLLFSVPAGLLPTLPATFLVLPPVVVTGLLLYDVKIAALAACGAAARPITAARLSVDAPSRSAERFSVLFLETCVIVVSPLPVDAKAAAPEASSLARGFWIDEERRTALGATNKRPNWGPQRQMRR